MNVEIGIIGGSGLYDMAELTDREEVTLTTPFGDPPRHTCSARLVAAAWRSSPGTERGTGSCRQSSISGRTSSG